MADVIDRLTDFYRDFRADQLDQLGKIYHQDAGFADPVHRTQGLPALEAYFRQVMTSVEFCRFEFDQVCRAEGVATLTWTMHFAHPKLGGGRQIDLHGCSVLRHDNDKVVFHRDYYDMGEMLYEHVPLLGRIIRGLKNKLAG